MWKGHGRLSLHCLCKKALILGNFKMYVLDPAVPYPYLKRGRSFNLRKTVERKIKIVHTIMPFVFEIRQEPRQEL